jgi:hypothetical protein
MKLAKLVTTAWLALAPAMAQYSSPTRNVDDAARNPFTYDANIALPNNVFSAFGNSILVPSGKRLVIDTVSVDGIQIPGSYGFFKIFVTGGSLGVNHVFPLQNIGVTGGFQQGMGNYNVLIVADSRIDVEALRSDASFPSGQSFSIHMSGHYVSLP